MIKYYRCRHPIPEPIPGEAWEGDALTFSCPECIPAAAAEPAPEIALAPQAKQTSDTSDELRRQERKQAWGWVDRPVPVRYRI